MGEKSMWAAVAVGVGGIVVGAYSASQASDSAGAAADKATAAQQAGNQQAYDAAMAELDFAKKKQEDWDKVYGPVQDNLGEYYKTLTPEKYEAAGVQKINEEFAKSQQNITRVLAQRGISGSGTEAASLTALEQTAATDRAGVRATADDKVAAEKKAFLQIGLNQSAGINQLTTGGFNALSTAGSNLATQSAASANTYNQLSQQAGQGVGTTIGTGISTLGQLYGAGVFNSTPSVLTGSSYNTANNIPDASINNGGY